MKAWPSCWLIGVPRRNWRSTAMQRLLFPEANDNRPIPRDSRVHMIQQNVKIEPSMLIAAYRSLYRTRRVEEEIARVYPTDKVKSPVHLSIGQEAISVAVCQALRPDDVVFGTYRCHAMYLAKGGDLSKMIAELYGKATGCAKGK